MNVLMYPLGPEDDFPDEFCAIRQGSGEHWFYTPVGESASWMLFRAESENAKLRNDTDLLRAMWSQERTEKRCHMAENAKLRELVADMMRYYAMPNDIDYKREADLLERAHEMGVDA